MALHADFIFTGGSVFTGRRSPRGEFAMASAVAITGDRIVAVGTDSEVEACAGPDTRAVRLHGRTLMCGLIDAHVHTGMYGTNQMGVCCEYPQVRSIADIKMRIAERARTTQPGQWIRGWGYNQNNLAEGRHPNRWDLDEVAPNHPVVIVRTDCHTAVVNSAAMRALRIGDHDPDPPGGEMGRYHGVVNGVLRELAYMKHADTAGYGVDEVIEGVHLASKQFISLGITSVHDAGGAQAKNFRAMQLATQSGKCAVRIYALLWSFFEDRELHEAFFGTGLTSGFGNDRLRLGPYKIMVDGSSSGPTAATRAPYVSQPGFSGILHFSPDEVTDRIVEAHRRGFDTAAHAVGDRAIDIVLTAFEEAQRRFPRPDARHRIEHAVMCAPDLQARMQRLTVGVASQPAWLYEFGDGYLQNYGEELVHHFKPLRSWLRRGIVPALSTDCPVVSPDPFRNIYAATTRLTRGGLTVPGEEQVSVAEALWMYTYGGARLAGEERLKGTIEAGKLADLTVLNRDVLKAAGEEILDTRVDLTMIGGELVYQR